MNAREGLVLLETSDLEDGLKILAQNRRYLDGLALSAEKIIVESIRDVVSTEAFKDLKSMLILCSSPKSIDVVKDIAGFLKGVEILVVVNELKRVPDVSRAINQDNVMVGVEVNRPTINLSSYAKAGADFIVIPPTLIRGRILTESRARRLKIIARPVNDVATCASLLELGVYGLVTTVPSIKREARKLVKL